MLAQTCNAAVCDHAVCVVQFRGAIPDGAPNPGKLGEEIAENAGGPNVKGAASEVRAICL